VAEGHELSIDPAPAVIEGVPDDLHRLVLNLLENAVRHTPPGTRVHASTAVQDGDAILVVADDGPGIAPELGRRVFDRFVRGSRDGGRGSGLGLAIVRAVVESHAGTVQLGTGTEEGTGTRFEIRIPTASREPQPAPVRESSLADTGPRRALLERSPGKPDGGGGR
jgi:signal transduction histidine kinase